MKKTYVSSDNDEYYVIDGLLDKIPTPKVDKNFLITDYDVHVRDYLMEDDKNIYYPSKFEMIINELPNGFGTEGRLDAVKYELLVSKKELQEKVKELQNE